MEKKSNQLGIKRHLFYACMFICGSDGKSSVCNAGDLGLIPGLGRSPGEGKGYSLQYPGLENCMDCIVHGVTKSQTQLKRLSEHAHSIYKRFVKSESESHSVMSDSLWPYGLYHPWNSLGQNTEAGSLSLLQGNFPTQVSCIAGGFFTSWATWEAQEYWSG